MNRATRISSAAFGMILLAGLAYYQGDPGMAPGQEESMMGTAVSESAQAEESSKAPASNEVSQPDCDPARNPEDPDFEHCEKISHQ